MRKPVLIALTILAALAILFLVFEALLETRLRASINSQPDREYDIAFKDLDISPFLRGAALRKVTISPQAISDTTTEVFATVDKIAIGGVRWGDLILRRRLHVGGIRFIQPDIKVYLGTVQDTSNRGHRQVQGLFSDVLSRADIRKFVLKRGSMKTYAPGSRSVVRSEVFNLNIDARGIQTDSILMRHTIPFVVRDYRASIDSLVSHIDEHSTLRVGAAMQDTRKSLVEINEMSMTFDRDWKQVNKEKGVQIDMIEFTLEKLTINGLDAKSSVYGDIDINARRIHVDGLNLMDRRDKNYPRPPDEEKPLFGAQVKAIPIPVKVDSIVISNSNVAYSEIKEGKTEEGAIEFNNIEGTIVDLTTITEQQEKLTDFHAFLNARLNNTGPLRVVFTIPYERDAFDLDVVLGQMAFDRLNTIITPMEGAELKRGVINRLHMASAVSRSASKNKMELDYSDLAIELLKETDARDQKERRFLSTLAGAGIRSSNLPADKSYIIAEYTSERNIYRSSFNIMWQSIKEGFLAIAVSDVARIFVDNESTTTIKVNKEHHTESKRERKEAKKHARQERKRKKHGGG